MRYRLKAAWMVLRGEWVAQPRLQFPSVWINNQDQYGNHCTSSGADVKVTWTQGV